MANPKAGFGNSKLFVCNVVYSKLTNQSKPVAKQGLNFLMAALLHNLSN